MPNSKFRETDKIEQTESTDHSDDSSIVHIENPLKPGETFCGLSIKEYYGPEVDSDCVVCLDLDEVLAEFYYG